jgi:hypothetical protein
VEEKSRYLRYKICVTKSGSTCAATAWRTNRPRGKSRVPVATAPDPPGQPAASAATSASAAAPAPEVTGILSTIAASTEASTGARACWWTVRGVGSATFHSLYSSEHVILVAFIKTLIDDSQYCPCNHSDTIGVTTLGARMLTHTNL